MIHILAVLALVILLLRPTTVLARQIPILLQSERPDRALGEDEALEIWKQIARGERAII